MAALTINSIGMFEDAGACNNGTRQFPAVAVLLADGATLFTGALAAGTAIIGAVKTDQTTHGTTDLVAADITKVAGAAVVTGHGTAAGAVRVELPTDGTGTVALIAGTAVVGKVGIDQTMPGTTNAVQAIPGTTGGCTPYSYLSAGSQDATVVKASAGQLYGSIAVTNINAAVRYLKVYDKASAPSGSDTPKLRIVIPGATTGAGIVIPLPDAGVAFAAGISFRLVTGVADNDANGVAATEVVINGLFYK